MSAEQAIIRVLEPSGEYGHHCPQVKLFLSTNFSSIPEAFSGWNQGHPDDLEQSHLVKVNYL